MSATSSAKKSQDTSEDRESRKVWVTLPLKYAEILDILADEPAEKQRSTRKAVLIEKMIDDYLEKHQKELSDEGKWEVIIDIRRRATQRMEEHRQKNISRTDRTIEEKILIIEQYFLTHESIPDNADLQQIKNKWNSLKNIIDYEKIEILFKRICEQQELELKSLNKMFERL